MPRRVATLPSRLLKGPSGQMSDRRLVVELRADVRVDDLARMSSQESRSMK
jgi:hypothetical protein